MRTRVVSYLNAEATKLEVSDNALEILGTEACTEELVPEPLPVKAQSKPLTSS